MSPETIENSVSVMETDLWALGCIIFKMLTGRVPFPGIQLYQVAPLITSRNIQWPKEPIDKDCRDLIEELLQIVPKDRLGAIGTTNDMKALMNHKFLEGIDFSSDLTKLNIKQALHETEVFGEPMSPIASFDLESETGAREFLIAKFGEI